MSLVAGRQPERRDSIVPLLLGTDWHSDHPGGLQRYMAELFESLCSEGMDTRATVLGPVNDRPRGVAAGGHIGELLPLRLYRYAATAIRMSHGVNVVDAHFALYAFFPVVVGPLRRLPLVVHFHGPWAAESVLGGDTSRWRLHARRSVERAVYRRASTLVVLSAAFKRQLVEQYGIAPWIIDVLAPGVDLHRFTIGDRTTARNRLGLPPEGVVVVAVRRLVPRMGLDVLVDAWAKVRPLLPAGELVIVGDGPERDRLREMADRSGAGGSVRFLGSVDDDVVVDCYRAADVSVVPSIALEGFGLVVLESLACGTPAIVSDSGGLPEAVSGLDSTAVVPAGDADALARRLSRGLAGTEPFADGERCRSHALSFGWPGVARRHRDIYVRAVERPPRRRLRVVYLDHCAQLSGGELALLRLLPTLDEVDAHVMLGEDGPLVDRLRLAGISVEVVAMAKSAQTLRRDQVRPTDFPPSVAVQTAAHAARLALRLRRLRPDLVHTNSLKAALYGAAAARLASVPAVCHIRDRIADDYLPAPARRLVGLALRCLPSAVITNSAATRATLDPGIAAAVIPDLVTAQVERRKPTDGPLRVGIVGRLAPWKGQHVFLQAFADAFPLGSEVAVIVGAALFGEDGYRADLHRQVRRLGLEGRVIFRGFQEDVGHELSQLAVLVHASTIPEPFGQVVVEGMAAGLPVIAANAGGPAEIIEDGVDGLLCPPGDTAALAALLKRLAADSGLRYWLGIRAQSSASRYTANRITPLVMEVYRGVMASKPGRAQPR